MTTIFMSTHFDFGSRLTQDDDGDDDVHSTADQSALSFLGFDMRDLDEDDTILRGINTSLDVPTFNFFEETHDQLFPNSVTAPPIAAQTTFPPGSTPRGIRQRRRRKRSRRPCTVVGCPNRVVQGGVCVAHGARRKACKFPDCDKSVKKAGFCSTHGPARKRCEIPGCSRVAVQGGICIGHGAKKVQCLIEGCRRQALLDGVCNAHLDQTKVACVPLPPTRGSALSAEASTATDHLHEIPTLLFPPSTITPTPMVTTTSAGYHSPSSPAFLVHPQCYEIPSLAVAAAVAEAPVPSRAFQQTMYNRGLSIFEEIGLPICNPMPPPPPLVEPNKSTAGCTFETVLQSLYDEELPVDSEKFESV